MWTFKITILKFAPFQESLWELIMNSLVESRYLPNESRDVFCSYDTFFLFLRYSQSFFALKAAQKLLSGWLNCHHPAWTKGLMFPKIIKKIKENNPWRGHLQLGARYLAAKAIPEVIPPPEIGT